MSSCDHGSKVELAVSGRDSVVGIATAGWTVPGSNPCRDKMCTFSRDRPHRLFSAGWNDRDVQLNPHIYVVPQLRISGAVPLLPDVILWRGQGNLYL